MIDTPVLEPHCRAFVVEGQGVALISHAAEYLLPERLYDELLPLLDGTSTEDLVKHFRGRWEPADVWCALWHLKRRGCVVERLEVDVRPPRPELRSAPRAAGVRIALIALGAIAAHDWKEALLELGFVLDDSAGLVTVLTDSYLRPELAEINGHAQRARRPWLLAKPDGPVIWLGPVFHPAEGGCWKCLEARLRRNRPLEYHLVHGTCPARSLDCPAVPTGAGDSPMAFASELARLLQCFDDETTGFVTTVDLTDSSRSRHRISRRPQCPACGSAGLYAQRTARPFTPRSQAKDPTGRGAGRVADPPETLVRFRGFLDPLVGVVHGIERLGAQACAPSHVYQAYYGSEPAPHGLALAACVLNRSCGRGRDPVEAQTGSLGEAIERYSGCFQGDEPRISASLEELGAAAVHPNLCMQYSDTQYRGRQEWNRRCAVLERVPAPVEPTRHLDWTPIWPLSGGTPRYLPTMLLYGDYPADPENARCLYDPSGSAAGNTPEEAVLQGLLELVERDSLAIWWYNRVSRPGVDLTGLRDPYCRGLISSYRSRGRDVWVLDLTSDLAIPAFAAVSRKVDGGPERIMLGSGAHLDPGLALARALSEMDQVLTCVTAWESEGTLDPTILGWVRSATLDDQPYLAPGPFSPVRLDDVPHLATSNVGEDIRVCERLLAERGMDVLVLDQTRPDIGVPVMKVIVPGLRHFRRRLAPGRLYTVPVAAGWLRQPRREAELNPIGFFL